MDSLVKNLIVPISVEAERNVVGEVNDSDRPIGDAVGAQDRQKGFGCGTVIDFGQQPAAFFGIFRLILHAGLGHKYGLSTI